MLVRRGSFESSSRSRIISTDPLPGASSVPVADPDAKAALKAMRKRGLSREDAERQIERKRRADPGPECWLLLGEGILVERILTRPRRARARRRAIKYCDQCSMFEMPRSGPNE
jgi:hypothetical protein